MISTFSYQMPAAFQMIYWSATPGTHFYIFTNQIWGLRANNPHNFLWKFQMKPLQTSLFPSFLFSHMKPPQKWISLFKKTCGSLACGFMWINIFYFNGTNFIALHNESLQKTIEMANKRKWWKRCSSLKAAVRFFMLREKY